MSHKGKEAFPTVFPNKKGSHDEKDWSDIPDSEKAYTEAKKRGEVVKFTTKRRAKKMAHGAWKKGQDRRDAMKGFRESNKKERIKKKGERIKLKGNGLVKSKK
jgi:hypothetical protein